TLDDAEVSRRHALARPVDGSVELADAGSANGTFVNGQRIDRPRRLVDGDLIRLGRTSLQFEVSRVREADDAMSARGGAHEPSG
ncbi:MAG: FHA domain-containing protein, partial [Gaiellaceae bacterium]